MKNKALQSVLLIVTMIAILSATLAKAGPFVQGEEYIPVQTTASPAAGQSLSQWVESDLALFAARSMIDGQVAAPTTPAPDVGITLASLPQSSFSNATFMVSIGMVQNNNATAAGNLENRLEVGYVLPFANKDLFIFGAIQNAGTGGVIDLEGGGFGFRKVLGNTGEIYAKIGGEHSSASHAYDLAFSIGCSYAPLTASTTPILNTTSLFIEEWAVHSFADGAASDVLRTVFGIRSNF